MQEKINFRPFRVFIFRVERLKGTPKKFDIYRHTVFLAVILDVRLVLQKIICMGHKVRNQCLLDKSFFKISVTIFLT